ncbi:MAG: hypothetical protein ACLTA0_06600 [Streptococcus agalactiae]
MSKIVVVGTNHAGTAAIKTMLSNYGEANEIVTFDGIQYLVLRMWYGSLDW